MCVIIVKKKGAKMPTKHFLKMAFRANHDGCGFVSDHDSYKSLSFEDFYRRLKNVRTDENCIIHFRWATHGSVRVENCHPFTQNGIYFAHNGILDISPVGDMTDSETWFRYVFMRFYDDPREAYDMASVEAQLTGSKFAFLDGGEVRLYGNFTEYSKGLYLSNLRFLPWPAQRAFYYSYA